MFRRRFNNLRQTGRPQQLFTGVLKGVVGIAHMHRIYVELDTLISKLVRPLGIDARQ